MVYPHRWVYQPIDQPWARAWPQVLADATRVLPLLGITSP